MQSLPFESLSREQKYAFQEFVKGQNLFITGAGGTGKTQLIHSFVEYCLSKKKEVAVCALTGCAAVLLNMKAKTIHSWSGIKLAKGSREKIIHSALKKKVVVDNWKKVQVLIIDEVSMMSIKILELLEEIARHVRRCSFVFGGIQIIFTGDFYQLPPIGDSNDPPTCQFCFQSKKWREIFPKKQNLVLLKSIFRQKDPIYQTILNEIRVGTLTEENIRILESRVGIQVGSQICTRLFAIKQKVECINRHNFDKLSDKEYHQHSIIKTNCKFYLDSGLPIVNDVMDQCLSMTAEDIDFEIKKMFSGLNVEEHFSMKKGAVVMLTFNLCVEDGLCNGSQGIIVDILEEISITDNTWLFTDKNSVPKISVPVVQFTNGIVRRIHPQFWQNDDYPRICVGQFPLILAWALTIHKIQGASLDRAEIDAGSSIFEYGQTYVGLSRVRSLEGLYLTNFHPQRIKAHPLVKEFYKNVRNDIPDFELLPNFEKEQDPIATANVVREIDFNIPMAHAVIVKKI